jgi:hypothetical protein
MKILTLSLGLFSLTLPGPALVPRGAASTDYPQDAGLSAKQEIPETPACPVTAPNGRGRSGERGGGNHGNEDLGPSLSPDGRVDFRPGGPGCVEPDGYLGMKWPWWRSVRGPLTIEGRRLDGPADPLRASIPRGYGDTGFQSTGLLFAGPGCWEVTGRVGDASLSFVTFVVKTAEGPAPRCSALFGGFRPSAQAPTQQK